MLNKSTHNDRVLFLKLFTQELILNSRPKEEKKEIKKKIIVKKEKLPKKLKKEVEIRKEQPPKKIGMPLKIQPIKKQEKQPIRQLTRPIEEEKLMTIQKPRPLLKPLTIEEPETLQKFTMPVSSAPLTKAGLNLGKLNIFLMDKAVTEIECPGPNEFIRVKKGGRINLTKVTLSQKEISEIIESFSEKARIPLIKGVFKASVENLTIVAVISEFVGSRFIIYKASPYSLLEQQGRQIRQAQVRQLIQNKI